MQDGIEKSGPPRERRQHPRIPARPRALVAVSGEEHGLPYHLLDISEGGMAFRHVGGAPLPLAGCRLDVYHEKELCVALLPVTAVADQPLANGFLPKRRCGVRFGELTPAQGVQLQAFLGSCSAGRA